MINLERQLNKWENGLSTVAAFPFIGIIPAVLKFGTGVIQTTAAVGTGIIFSMPALCGDEFSKKACHHSWRHIKHGLANIGVSILEGMPIMGTYMYTDRRDNLHRYCPGCYTEDEVNRGQVRNYELDFKFYPYETLVEHHNKHSFKRVTEHVCDLGVFMGSGI